MAGATGVYPCYENSFRLTKLQPKARHLMSILQTVRLLELHLTTILKSGHHLIHRLGAPVNDRKRRDYHCYSKEKRRRRRK